MTPWESLSRQLTRLSDSVDMLPSFREAVVSSVSPLAVTFDTDTVPTLVQNTLVGGVTLSSRVLTLRIRHYLWIVGVKGGSSAVLPPRLADYLPSLGAVDLNTVNQSGWYLQNSNSNATLARNYPVASRAGHLEVQGGTISNGFTLQTYTEYIELGGTLAPRQWRRTYYNGIWEAWFLVGIVNNGTISATTPPSGFELGYTYGDTDSSWPAGLGTVEVVRKADVRAIQRLTEKSGWQRTFHRTAVDAATWSPWVQDGGDSDWKGLTTQNAWTSTGALAYRIRGEAVLLRGELMSGANQTVCFNLPTEARPPQRTAVMIARFATTSTPAYGTLAINTTGDCTFNLVGGTIPTASPGLALFGIQFTTT